MLSANNNSERWKNYFIVGTPKDMHKVERSISAEELREKFKEYRILPISAYQEALNLMANCPSATLLINDSDDFSTYRFEKKTEHVYINHFKDDAEFWI